MKFLEETLETIIEAGHSRNDVAFVGSKDGEYRISFNAFEKIANIKYDSGFGAPEIAQDLIVYFNNGDWLERREYDGSEWWQIMKPLRFRYDDKNKYKSFDKVSVNETDDIGWKTLEELNTSTEG